MGGETALHEAVKRCSFDVVSVLVVKGADPTITDKRGDSPLALAIRVGYYTIVQRLLESTDSTGLQYQFSQQDVAAVEKFLAPLRNDEGGLPEKERKNLES